MLHLHPWLEELSPQYLNEWYFDDGLRHLFWIQEKFPPTPSFSNCTDTQTKRLLGQPQVNSGWQSTHESLTLYLQQVLSFSGASFPLFLQPQMFLSEQGLPSVHLDLSHAYLGQGAAQQTQREYSAPSSCSRWAKVLEGGAHCCVSSRHWGAHGPGDVWQWKFPCVTSPWTAAQNPSTSSIKNERV